MINLVKPAHNNSVLHYRLRIEYLDGRAHYTADRVANYAEARAMADVYNNELETVGKLHGVSAPGVAVPVVQHADGTFSYVD